MSRSFDQTKWHLPIHAIRADIYVGDLSLREESLRRKTAFYLDDDGEPVSQALCPASTWFPVLISRITSAHLVDARAVLHVDAALPLTTAIADVAFPGNELAGARMADITVVDLSGHRRTVHAELPPNVSPTATIALALRAVDVPKAVPAQRQIAVSGNAITDRNRIGSSTSSTGPWAPSPSSCSESPGLSR